MFNVEIGMSLELMQVNRASSWLIWGNLAFFLVRVSRCPIHFRQQSQGPSHIPIAERSFLMRYLMKVGIPLETKPGNQLSSRDDLWYMGLVPVAAVNSGSL